jgi:hypothetical protein
MEEEEALIDKYMAYFEEKGVEEINIPGIQVE